MSKTRSKRRKSKPSSKQHWAPLRSARVWMAIGWVGVFAAAAYGLHRLEPHARGLNTNPTVIEWASAPKWLGDENWKPILQDLEARIDLPEDADIFDDRVCAYVAEQLADSAWIDRVRKVTKQQDGRVRIYADFRKPFAMIERDTFVYLVDARGVRLPFRYYSRDVNRRGWFVIEGARAEAPSPGERWAGGDVAAGLKLAEYLCQAEIAGKTPFRDSITAIDVGNHKGRKNPRGGWLRLVTINPQSYIHWGLAPGEEYGVESSAELKLAMLSQLYRSDGMLPDRGPIDVRDDDAVIFGEPN